LPEVRLTLVIAAPNFFIERNLFGTCESILLDEAVSLLPELQELRLGGQDHLSKKLLWSGGALDFSFRFRPGPEKKQNYACNTKKCQDHDDLGYNGRIPIHEDQVI